MKMTNVPNFFSTINTNKGDKAGLTITLNGVEYSTRKDTVDYCNLNSCTFIDIITLTVNITDAVIVSCDGVYDGTKWKSHNTIFNVSELIQHNRCTKRFLLVANSRFCLTV